MAIADIVKSMISRGMSRDRILQSLVEMGITEETAADYINKAMAEAGIEEKPQKKQEILPEEVSDAVGGILEAGEEVVNEIAGISKSFVGVGDVERKLDELLAISKSLIELNKQILETNRKILIRLNKD